VLAGAADKVNVVAEALPLNVSVKKAAVNGELPM
jgi:hypothetical protein